MIFRDKDNAAAYKWTTEAGGFWEKFGDVMQGGGHKKEKFAGNKTFPKGDYDYVFKIDLNGQMMDLPYNDGQSKIEIAEKFLRHYNLVGEGFEESITNHIA